MNVYKVTGLVRNESQMAKRTTQTNPFRAALSLIVSAFLCTALLPSMVWAAEEDSAGDVAGTEGGAAADTSAGADQEVPEEPPASGDDGDSADDGNAAQPDPDDSTSDETADDGKQQDASDDDQGKSEDQDKEAKEEPKEESSDSETSPWARKQIASAQSGLSDSNAAMGQLPGALSSLRSAKAVFDEAYDAMAATESELTEVTERLDKAQRRVAIARPAALAAQDELDGIENAEPHTFAVTHGISLMEAQTRIDQLLLISESATAVADEADSEIATCKARKDELSELLIKQRQAVDEALVQANSCAFEAERCCSEARSGEVAAKEALAELSSKITEADGARADLDATISSHDGVRYSAYGELDAWYSDLDERIGAEEGRLTFGTGLDFAMSEEDFVAKWASAIDAYYGELGGTPLSGYGEQMAREAYEWKIDPRLCAAVSFTESGGGRVCIRNCNAWGWGAADTDPYNLASEWGSWEEAISAWYSGMGTNGMGLATARCVDELGSSYAGAPHWTANVVTAMARIDEIARSQADDASSSLSVASE